MAVLGSVLDLTLVYAAGIALCSAVIHGYTGFGGALFMIPLFTLLFGPVEAIGVATIIGIAGSAQLYPAAARIAAWRELIPLIAGVILLTPVGIALLLNIEAAVIRRVMGLLILLFALVLMTGWAYRGTRNHAVSGLVGAIAGGINGVTGVGGPPLVLYFLSSPAPPGVQRGNIIISVLTIIAVGLVGLIIAGAISGQTIVRAAILAPAYVLGAWSGAKLFSLAPKTYFRRVALVLLIMTGLVVSIL